MPLLWGLEEYNSALNHIVNSVCRRWVHGRLQAGVACGPWAGFYCERQQSSVMAGGRVSSELQKHVRGSSASVLQRKKKPVIYYSNEMRSGRWWKRGRRLAAENLLLSTSVISLGPWRNKKFKGNQRSWQLSLAYFQWATLEAETGGRGELGLYPMLINVCCIYKILQALYSYIPDQRIITLSCFRKQQTRQCCINVNDP